MIGARFVWVFTVTLPASARSTGAPQQLARRASCAAPRVVVGWAGMRGAVSLAAALALPFTTDAGDAVPRARR